MASLRVFAPAKINLFLHVGDRRADGFHTLQSLVVFTEAGDTLSLDRDEALTLAVDGPFGAGLAGEADNLVLKAARALSKTARMTLTKDLPVASGIGGGSADAAAALRGLTQLYGLDEPLHPIAATLGSDVPVCVESCSAWMEGRGELVTAVMVPSVAMVLVNPGVAVPTADVFRALEPRRGTGMTLPDGFESERALFEFLSTTSNDLEAPARAIQPVIGEVLEALAGARLARMSGSGATCFGVFDSDADAASAAREIAAGHPAWWVQPTRTLQ